MVTRKNDEAVSPVIGVILMVAITVILAAVIAAFVFGMSGNINKTKTVAITVQKLDASTIQVMNNGGQDATSLTTLVVTTSPVSTNCVNGLGTGVNITFSSGNPCQYGPITPSMPVGSTVKMSTTAVGGYGGKTSVSAVGTFTDGSQQVLLDTNV